jgi:hypothetical protein
LIACLNGCFYFPFLPLTFAALNNSTFLLQLVATNNPFFPCPFFYGVLVVIKFGCFPCFEKCLGEKSPTDVMDNSMPTRELFRCSRTLKKSSLEINRCTCLSLYCNNSVQSALTVDCQRFTPQSPMSGKSIYRTKL